MHRKLHAWTTLTCMSMERCETPRECEYMWQLRELRSNGAAGFIQYVARLIVWGLLYKLFENADRIVTREACVRDCMRFRRQQVWGWSANAWNPNTCRIAGVRSTELSVTYTVCGTIIVWASTEFRLQTNISLMFHVKHYLNFMIIFLMKHLLSIKYPNVEIMIQILSLSCYINYE